MQDHSTAPRHKVLLSSLTMFDYIFDYILATRYDLFKGEGHARSPALFGSWTATPSITLPGCSGW